MKRALLLLIAIVLSDSTFAQSDLVKVSLLKLGAVTVGNSRKQGATAAPNKEAARITTAHGSSVEITVENAGATPESVTVRWFAVGRYETSKNFFRNGDGEKTLKIAPKASEAFVADCAIDSHETKSTKGSYKSGGKLVGWVVAMYDSKGKLQAATASDPALERFAADPPNLQHKGKAGASE